MRIFPVVASASALLAISLMQAGHVSAAGQEASPSSQKPVLGYQDPKTGVFHHQSTVIPEAVTAPIAGTITLTLHITLKTVLATGSKVACTSVVTASYTGISGSTFYDESAEAFATVSGTTATCVVSIPHSWQFPAPVGTDVEALTGSYSAEIVNPAATTTTVLPLERQSVSGFLSLQGANIFATAPSTFSVNVTL